MNHKEALAEVERLRAGIRDCRDQRGDDRCWRDLEKLYQLLPEGYTPPERDTKVELKRCEKYIEACNHPGTVYVSPQREIDRLEIKERELVAVGRTLVSVAKKVNVFRQAANSLGVDFDLTALAIEKFESLAKDVPQTIVGMLFDADHKLNRVSATVAVFSTEVEDDTGDELTVELRDGEQGQLVIELRTFLDNWKTAPESELANLLNPTTTVWQKDEVGFFGNPNPSHRKLKRVLFDFGPECL